MCAITLNKKKYYLAWLSIQQITSPVLKQKEIKTIKDYWVVRSHLPSIMQMSILYMVFLSHADTRVYNKSSLTGQSANSSMFELSMCCKFGNME